ncbi:MAG: FAD-dependent oxidoreductase [Nitriliruptorales bacterium]|nr:FAD-dependent oxidoreductase [Nitriliruptorales bacterium]
MNEPVSPWLEDTGDLVPRPHLPGDRDVDVVILGAGYTGLWTALELQQRSPGIRIGIVEANYAGFGGSGRNGAWCVAGVGITLAELTRRFGEETARYVTNVMQDTVDEVGRACSEHVPRAGFHKGGVLRLARGAHEVPLVREALELRRRLGVATGCELLTADEVRNRVVVAGVQAAMADAHCATIHPGYLVRGLAQRVEERGAVLWEGTRATGISPGGAGRRPELHTDRGDVRADVVVVAGEAYLSQLPQFHRHVLPIYSLAVMTAPLTPSQLQRVGWQDRECLSSQRMSVDYLSRTADGRILFGGRGAPYRLGSRITPGQDRHGPTHGSLRRQFAQWFPQLGDVDFTHTWGGPVGMPRDWIPTFSYRADTGLAAAFGYTGQGVAASNLAGRVLADLITGKGAAWSRLPFVGHHPRRWEPEPARWIAVRALQRAVGRLDDRARSTGKAPTGRSLTERLIRH